MDNLGKSYTSYGLYIFEDKFSLDVNASIKGSLLSLDKR